MIYILKFLNTIFKYLIICIYLINYIIMLIQFIYHYTLKLNLYIFTKNYHITCNNVLHTIT